jgi:hypothetical protein
MILLFRLHISINGSTSTIEIVLMQNPTVKLIQSLVVFQDFQHKMTHSIPLIEMDFISLEPNFQR